MIALNVAEGSRLSGWRSLEYFLGLIEKSFSMMIDCGVKNLQPFMIM